MKTGDNFFFSNTCSPLPNTAFQILAMKYTLGMKMSWYSKIKTVKYTYKR